MRRINIILNNIGEKMNDTTKTITEEEVNHNPILSMVVEKDSDLKEYLVEYVGTKMDKEEVTVEMITEVLAVEFPEFMYSMAEENFLLGYKQGLDDAEKLYNRKTEPTEE
jgi:outer membrane lipoprotein-sorting protein